jgi:ribosomal protein S18 acetylase RimI-like enzyme
MRLEEAEEVGHLFERILMGSPYYNDRAKSAELAKYSPALLASSVTDEPDSVLVAKVGSTLAGYCLSRKDDELIWLSWFGVLADHHRRGVGTALLRKLDSVAQQSKVHKIWCDCRTENVSAKFALMGHGFQPLCTVKNHWYGQDFILWEKFVA